ncbi:MAG: 50S ribosomal protein L11 methyltransferase [Burkholderiales bacterium]|nr:50S ribosomal protein L11 methyltransferase [Burkholderiales bacterium]
MAWQRVNLVVSGADAEALTDALEAHGAVSTDLSDADAGTAAEREVLAEAPGETAPWDRCRVSALFGSDADVSGAIDAALGESGTRALEGASLDRLEDVDWVVLTQRQFEPIRAGERLWIVPTWHEPPRPGDVNIMLDPGAAFGTGSHPTTRMCLAWLETNVRRGDSVLDYGCGSGILGIAALKLGAASAAGVDVDPLALEAARYNSLRNAVALDVQDAQLALRGAFRITVANILANPLRMLAPVIASHTLPQGLIALSGILDEQAAAVREAYAPWAALEAVACEGQWVLLAGRRC